MHEPISAAPDDLLAPMLRPRFSAPNVAALMTTRAGGVSQPPFDSLNLRPEVGDDPQAVAENRRRLQATIRAQPVRLDQVHGADVIELAPALVDALPRADASLSLHAGLACEVQVADCLPVLYADRHGRGVAAAHAGWRGLAGGIVEATLARLCTACGAQPHEIEVWLGACIGPEQFEVGADVLIGCGADPDRTDRPHPHFSPKAAVEGVPKWWADLPGMARARLAAAGAETVLGNDGSAAWCTVSQSSRFFSFRRERRCGRMSALVWLCD